jgi:hypothetical protein
VSVWTLLIFKCLHLLVALVTLVCQAVLSGEESLALSAAALCVCVFVCGCIATEFRVLWSAEPLMIIIVTDARQSGSLITGISGSESALRVNSSSGLGYRD